MAYREYDGSLPDGTTQTVVTVPESTRVNADASIDGMLMGGITKDINMSIVGDAEMPSVITYSRGATSLRTTITWDADLKPIEILYERSDNSGVDWAAAGVKTILWYEGSVTDAIWQAPDVPAFATIDFANTGSIGARASISRSSIATVVDNYGGIIECMEDEARFHKLRRVHNVALNSDNGATFVLTNGAALESGSTFSMPQGGAVSVTSISWYASLRRWTVSVRLRAGSANDIGRSVTLKVQGNGGDFNDAATLVVTLTEAYTPYAVTGLPAQSDDWGDGVRLTIENTDVDVALLSVDIFEPQLEDVSSRPTHAPSEYVSSVAYHGAGVMGVKYFTTANDNSTASGVVTEATGDPLTGARGLMTEGEITNLLTNTFNLLSGEWTTEQATIAATYDIGEISPVGTVFIAKITTATADPTPSSEERGLSQSIVNVGVNGGTRINCSVVVKRLSGTGRVGIAVYDDGGRVCYADADEYGLAGGDGPWSRAEELQDGWWSVYSSGLSRATGGTMRVIAYALDNDVEFLVCAPQVFDKPILGDLSSYMPSDGQVGMRSADVLQITTPDVHDNITVVTKMMPRYWPYYDDEGVVFKTKDSRGAQHECQAIINEYSWEFDATDGPYAMHGWANRTSYDNLEWMVTTTFSVENPTPTERLERILYNSTSRRNTTIAGDILDHSDTNTILLGGDNGESIQTSFVHAYFAIYGTALTDEDLTAAYEAASENDPT